MVVKVKNVHKVSVRQEDKDLPADLVAAWADLEALVLVVRTSNMQEQRS